MSTKEWYKLHVNIKIQRKRFVSFYYLCFPAPFKNVKPQQKNNLYFSVLKKTIFQENTAIKGKISFKKFILSCWAALGSGISRQSNGHLCIQFKESSMHCISSFVQMYKKILGTNKASNNFAHGRSHNKNFMPYEICMTT